MALSVDSQPLRTSPEKQRMMNAGFSYFDFAPIIMNSTNDEFYKEPAFFALGHFSKFMPMGSIIIDVHIENTAATNINTGVDPSSISDNDQSLPPPTGSPTPGPGPQPTASPWKQTVMAVASKNPDGSHTVIIHNP